MRYGYNDELVMRDVVTGKEIDVNFVGERWRFSPAPAGIFTVDEGWGELAEYQQFPIKPNYTCGSGPSAITAGMRIYRLSTPVEYNSKDGKITVPAGTVVAVKFGN